MPYLYGPLREAGAHTAPSNAAFDVSLRAGHAAWGGATSKRSRRTICLWQNASRCRPTISV